jgi:AcrR family transcriptional regulator
MPSVAYGFLMASQTTLRSKMLEKFAACWAEQGEAPPSVAAFCKSLKIKEGQFYAEFPSLGGLEKALWHDWIGSVIDALSAGPEWKSFSARERYLAFLFSLIQSAQERRSLLLQRLGGTNPLENPARFEAFQTCFLAFAKKIVAHGEESGEIARRPGLEALYPRVLYTHLRWVLDFYLKDESSEFERTDVFIEKTVGVAFEFLRTQVIDSAADLARFLFQPMKWCSAGATQGAE